MKSPIQTILFGSPGTGKSYHVKTEVLPSLGVQSGSANCITTVFHPEYSYGDFMGKLLPHSTDGKVEYNYISGHFLTALARAYKNWLEKGAASDAVNVALVIDEINRGNSAAIFGTVFQLLDRDSDGWSTYEVTISDMEFDTLIREMGGTIDPNYGTGKNTQEKKTYFISDKQYTNSTINEFLRPLGLTKNQIKLPPNLSLIATMNTSDNSIYYMDIAFKRRWEWQYVNNDNTLSTVDGVAFGSRAEWEVFVQRLNEFIRSNHKVVRKVEDKQIGHWFVTGDNVPKSQIQNKVMFYLWDSVFGSTRKPLSDLLNIPQEELVTFGDFASKVDDFLVAIKKR